MYSVSNSENGAIFETLFNNGLDDIFSFDINVSSGFINKNDFVFEKDGSEYTN